MEPGIVRRTAVSTVLYMANAAHIGGGGRVFMDLMVNLDRGRFRPVLVAPGAGPMTEWAGRLGIAHHVCRAGDWTSAAGLARRTAALVPVILRERAAIVHAAAPMCYRALGAAGFLTRAIRVCHLGFPPAPGELHRSFVSVPDAVIGCYEGQAADHAEEIHRMHADCRVVGICNGVDTNRFAPALPDEEGRSLRGGAEHVIAILGHLSDVKGHPEFVEAAGLLSRQFANSRFLAIGGENIQPGMRARLEQRARDLGLGDRVQFLGFRNDVARVIAAADVVVLPSHAEGFPLAVLEAMACGKPVIATPVGGVAEAVVDGVTGLLTPPGNPAALAEAIARLVSDEALRRRMGAAARRRIEERFSMTVFARAVQGVYSDLVDKAPTMRTTAA
jgi:glycosyltransferase involved in cell wall biosynthesis